MTQMTSEYLCALYIVKDRDLLVYPQLLNVAWYWCKWHMEDEGYPIVDAYWERDIRHRHWILSMYPGESPGHGNL